MAPHTGKDEWKCTQTDSGEPFVTIIGMWEMLEWSAGAWASPGQRSPSPMLHLDQARVPYISTISDAVEMNQAFWIAHITALVSTIVPITRMQEWDARILMVSRGSFPSISMSNNNSNNDNLNLFRQYNEMSREDRKCLGETHRSLLFGYHLLLFAILANIGV